MIFSSPDPGAKNNITLCCNNAPVSGDSGIGAAATAKATSGRRPVSPFGAHAMRPYKPMHILSIGENQVNV